MRVRLKVDRLVELVAQGRLSQNHWAIKLGISRGHWSAILKGRYPFPSPKTRDRLLEVFQVAFEDLFVVDSGPDGTADAGFQAAIADRYLLERVIGHGGMGTVYLARDVKHNRPVAMKVVSPEAVSGIGVPQFLKETRYAARLQHPNILPLHDSGDAAGSPFYVMPLVAGGSLRDLLKQQGRLSLSVTLGIADHVAQALQHAHEVNILHCDIKPENILLAGRGDRLHAYLGDFGLSRAMHAEFLEWGRRAELDSSAGTPAYVSPEQASGEVNLQPTADVYSFGCTVYEMLCGTPAFSGTTTMETVAKRFIAEPPDVRRLAPDVPRGVALAVKRAMARDPADRFATPVELVTAIERAVLASPVGVMTVPGRVAATLIAASRRVVRRKPFSRRRNPLMEQMRQDLRYAVRSLIRQPLFALIVLLTLALAIGLNTAIFSVLHGVLLSPLSYDQPHELVRVGRTRPELPGVLLPISPANFRDIRPQITTLSALEAEAGRSLILADETGATSISGAAVSAGMFDLLAVPPRWGRTFQPGDDDPNAERVVVVSDEFWRTYLGADSTVVGTTIRLSDANFTIIGVMPRRFTFGGRQLWIPLRFTEDDFAGRSTNYLRLYGRLGATTQSQAITELDAQWRRLGEQYAESYDLSGMSTMPLLDAFVERSVRPLRVLGVAVLFVLMIACANVANLMLARTERRSREIAVRAALGAGRGRLARQFLTETVIVSLLGGAIGVGLAFGGVQLLLATFADAVPRAEAVSVNMPVLTFSLVISLVTGLIVGLAPALLAQGDVADLKDGERGGSGRTTPLRQALVVGEIAIALMLVIGAGLMLQEFLARAPVRPGIRSGSSRRRQSLVPAHDVRWRRTARPVHRESHGASRGHS